MLGLDVLLAKTFYVGVTGFTYGSVLSGFALLDDAVRGGRAGLRLLPSGLRAAGSEGLYTARVLAAGMAAAGCASLLLHGGSAPSRVHRLPFPSPDDRASTWVGCLAALLCAVPRGALGGSRGLHAAAAASGATALTALLLLYSPPEPRGARERR